ncbi:hypothetical protein BOTBODRAFT_190429 [Botryobasidium botryosum FD-172 SS1]|uniref:Serine hydroxymethyltransferase-like domain-containing protein n=1 Tax=Botryobasidium botryosum (strain FD-172 SS1) TaxID=930990 RepID=A0A067M4H2_BOTB1|nr:hypothetical protein BOTBODRAFT_190429 [Botryobasidium botryosum FD-172 SS1]
MYFQSFLYALDSTIQLIHYAELHTKAPLFRLCLIIHTHLRDWGYMILKEIADEHGAYLLVAAQELNDLFEYRDVVTATARCAELSFAPFNNQRPLLADIKNHINWPSSLPARAGPTTLVHLPVSLQPFTCLIYLTCSLPPPQTSTATAATLLAAQPKFNTSTSSRLAEFLYCAVQLERELQKAANSKLLNDFVRAAEAGADVRKLNGDVGIFSRSFPMPEVNVRGLVEPEGIDG